MRRELRLVYGRLTWVEIVEPQAAGFKPARAQPVRRGTCGRYDCCVEFAKQSEPPLPWLCQHCGKFGWDCLCPGSTHDLYQKQLQDQHAQDMNFIHNQTPLFKD